MNLSALPELLVAWFKNQGAGLLRSGQGQEAATPAFRPGQQYQGEVLENLANGRSLVRVGRETLDMALPGRTARPGETLRLTFVSAAPRPTFVLDAPPAASAAQPVRLSDAAQQVTALMRYAQATVASPSAQTIPAAQRALVGNVNLLLESAPPPTALSSALAGRAAIPAMSMSGQAVDGLRSALAPSTHLAAQGVAEAAPGDAHTLPLRLRQTLTESGLFYESHLARWVRGRMPQEALLREPQAHFDRAGASPTGVSELHGMSDEAARMAGRQLMLLEGAPFTWLGQAWPGQDMHWSVEERPGGDGAEGEASQWHTELRLTLPRLGDICAELRLSAQGLWVGLGSGSDATLEEMRAALPDLADRLCDAKLGLTGLSARLMHADGATAD